AAEMTAICETRLGFQPPISDDPRKHEKRSEQMSRAGVAAARKRFTPEFINRLDKIVTFKPLGRDELREIVNIELDMVQDRIFNSSKEKGLSLNVGESAREFLLAEGIDPRYGARHLKRAIERLLVQPVANLIASAQIHQGDFVRVSHRNGASSL